MSAASELAAKANRLEREIKAARAAEVAGHTTHTATEVKSLVEQWRALQREAAEAAGHGTGSAARSEASTAEAARANSGVGPMPRGNEEARREWIQKHGYTHDPDTGELLDVVKTEASKIRRSNWDAERNQATKAKQAVADRKPFMLQNRTLNGEIVELPNTSLKIPSMFTRGSDWHPPLLPSWGFGGGYHVLGEGAEASARYNPFHAAQRGGFPLFGQTAIEQQEVLAGVRKAAAADAPLVTATTTAADTAGHASADTAGHASAAAPTTAAPSPASGKRKPFDWRDTSTWTPKQTSLMLAGVAGGTATTIGLGTYFANRFGGGSNGNTQSPPVSQPASNLVGTGQPASNVAPDVISNVNGPSPAQAQQPYGINQPQFSYNNRGADGKNWKAQQGDYEGMSPIAAEQARYFNRIGMPTAAQQDSYIAAGLSHPDRANNAPSAPQYNAMQQAIQRLGVAQKYNQGEFQPYNAPAAKPTSSLNSKQSIGKIPQEDIDNLTEDQSIENINRFNAKHGENAHVNYLRD